MQLGGNLLRMNILKPLGYENLSPVDLRQYFRGFEHVVLVVGISQPEQVVDDSGQNLLESRFLLGSDLDGLLVKFHDAAVNTYIIDRLLPVEEIVGHPIIDVAALKSNPELIPPRLSVGAVIVPFAGKEQEHIAFGKRDEMVRANAPGGKTTLTAGDIKQLKFIEDTPVIRGKTVTRRMHVGRIGHAGGNTLETDRIGRHAPVQVGLADCQILYMDRVVHTGKSLG